MRAFFPRLGVFLGFLVAGAVEAQDPQRAREELERELKRLVQIPPPRAEIVFEALDEPNHRLEDVEFTLDGAPLATPGSSALDRPGAHVVFSGQVKEGEHTLVAKVTYADISSFVVSESGGYRWKVTSSSTFGTQRGLEVRVVVTPALDAAAKDIKKRLRLSSSASAKMIARLEDGTMPEAPAPRLGAEPDAGAAVAQAPVDDHAQAAEEKKRKAEEAKEARRLAAEEKKLKAEEAREAKRLAAEERKRKAEEAREAKRLAAEEKKLKAEEAKRLAAGEGGPSGPSVAPPGEATPSEVAAAPPFIADAGPFAVAEASIVADAGAPAAEPAERAGPTEPAASGFPVPLAVAIGAAVLAVIVFFVSRRRR